LPSTTITEDRRHLWYTEALRNEEMVVLENLPDDLPKEAFAERQFCIEQGLRSHLCIPLSMGKTSPMRLISVIKSYMHKAPQNSISTVISLPCENNTSAGLAMEYSNVRGNNKTANSRIGKTVWKRCELSRRCGRSTRK
jgi:hypothetical protein